MRSLLFLCHRLPWPPDKGDKIRSWHVLRRLASHYRIHLGAFVDDPADWQYVDAVRELCADTCIRPLTPASVRRRALAALGRGEPVTVGCYRDRVMQAWVNELVGRRGVDLALCYCSGVAPFVLRHAHLPRVMDFVDADSDKWRQYAKDRRGLARWLYAREARRLAAFEIDVAKQFDVGLFVSDAEAGFFRDRSPAVADKIRGIANGVDADYWNPERAYPVLYQVGERVVVFVGAMDYRANADAAQWFAREVWPRVAAQRTDARFYIVGSRPNRDVLALAKLPGITVTGKVDDVRPYLAHAHAVVTPLRIARGIQNKVLEALAMEKVVLATPAAWEGIDDFPGREGCITDAADEMAAQALVWLDREPPAQVPAAREMVRARFDWTRNLDTYVDVLAGAGSAATGMATSRATAAEACP